ncbi:helix-turn-helix domain-containing protein [Streptomyces sp. KLMMK]
MEVAQIFADGQPNGLVAKQLRVSVRSVQRWRREYEVGGEGALRLTGSAGRPQLSDELFATLEAELDKGPVAHGWPVEAG